MNKNIFEILTFLKIIQLTMSIIDEKGSSEILCAFILRLCYECHVVRGQDYLIAKHTLRLFWKRYDKVHTADIIDFF